MKKRGIGLFLILALCLSILPLGVSAVDIPANVRQLPPEGTASSANGWYRLTPVDTGVYELSAAGANPTYRVYVSRLAGADLAAAEEALAGAAQQLASGREALRQGEQQYEQALAEYEPNKQLLEKGKAEIEANRPRYELYKAMLSNPLTANEEIRWWVTDYEWQLSELEKAELQIADAERQLREARAALDDGYAQLAQGQAEYDSLKSLIDASKQGKSGNPILRYEGGDHPLWAMLCQGSEYYIQVETAGDKTLSCKRLCDSFSDVPDDAYYFDPVYWAAVNEITLGTGDGMFSPESPCTRAQVVTFLWRTLGGEKATARNPFSDVSTSDYYYDAVLWAVKNGVTVGTDETHFSPEETCTRAQVVTFLWRALSGEQIWANMRFGDVSRDEYYFNAVSWAYVNEITQGTSLFTFGPNDPCSRAQVVTFLYRAAA